VPANAALPEDGAQHADAWVHLALNGGKHGLERALEGVSGSRRVGAVALARGWDRIT
jgi:hypothetical protein